MHMPVIKATAGIPGAGMGSTEDLQKVFGSMTKEQFFDQANETSKSCIIALCTLKSPSATDG